MILVGEFDSEPVYYEKEYGVVHCKHVSVFLKHLIAFQKSDKIRASMDSELTISKTEEGFYRIGCLKDSKEKFDSLISKALKL